MTLSVRVFQDGALTFDRKNILSPDFFPNRDLKHTGSKWENNKNHNAVETQWSKWGCWVKIKHFVYESDF